MDYDLPCQDQTDSHELAAAAKQRLARIPYPALRRVSCEYEAGVLSLRGRLPDYYHKQLAQEAVAGLPGVVRVVNETEVVAAPA